LLKSLLSHADVLTFLSPLNCAVAARLFPEVRTEFLMFGVRIDEMRPASVRDVSGPIRILSLGNDEHRDWPTLLTAVAGVGWETRIATANPDAARLAAKLDDVHVVRPDNNDSLFGLYQWADIVVVPLTENQHASGITVIEEAIVLGKPVIATDVGGLRDYFDGVCVQYIPVGDPAAMRQAIVTLASDRAGSEAMVVRAQARMRGAVNAEHYALRHVEISRQLMRPAAGAVSGGGV
jgi:glycosyltransferase involved in cell wall biosynthesis